MNNLTIALYYIAIVVLASVFFKKETYDPKERLPLEESKIINPMDLHLSALHVSKESRDKNNY